MKTSDAKKLRAELRNTTKELAEKTALLEEAQTANRALRESLVQLGNQLQVVVTEKQAAERIMAGYEQELAALRAKTPEGEGLGLSEKLRKWFKP